MAVRPRISQTWREQLIMGEKSPRACLANAITALSEAPEWLDVLWHDAFANRTVARGRPPYRGTQQGEVPWTDRDDVLTADWLQHEGIQVGPLVVGHAVEAVAGGRRFHPVLDYLASLTWDGVPRLDTWATDFLGVQGTPYSHAVSAKWMISAIARVSRPGCKADHMLVLEGAQGILKSTALKALTEPWFTDELGDMGSKDSAMQVAGMWVLEVSELDAMARGDISRVKAFITRTTDRFRPPYGKRLVEQARQCVLAGTVNDSSWLRDETGGRRWWPLVCNRVNIDGLADARGQLWAEAQARYEAGEAWWLDDAALKAGALDEQATRYQPDAWATIIAEHVKGLESTSIMELMRDALGISKDRMNRFDQLRIGAILRTLDWERYQHREGDIRHSRFRRRVTEKRFTF